jgi:AcrR family transcriptional regulator
MDSNLEIMTGDGIVGDSDFSIAGIRRKQIIEAARACITDEGFDRLTMRKVAERAQVSHATIAYYFHSRRELIDSALLEISKDFMVELRQRHLVYGTKDLINLVETFLDPSNASARFVVGMQEGGLRDDLDPVVAAALLHGVLIWWEAEQANDATTHDLAQAAAFMMLHLLSPADAARSPDPNSGRQTAGGATKGSSPWTRPSTVQVIETCLQNDSELTPEVATNLADVYRRLYDMAAEASLVTRTR